MNSVKKILCIFGLLASVLATPTSITAPPVSEKISVMHDKDELKEMFGHCLHKKDVGKCLKHRVVQVIDEIIQSDDPLSVNLFHINMSLNKNPQFKNNDNVVDTSRSFEDTITHKLKNLFESRIIQVKLAEETKENSDDASLGINEARKKKDGGKHGNMMMSGMALMAFLAQLFMSKVAFMSGAALLLAKIALLFTALSSLKKSSGSGGGEHVVYAAADSGKQGWQRSIHTMSPVVSQHQQHHMTEDLAYRGQSTMPTYDGV